MTPNSLNSGMIKKDFPIFSKSSPWHNLVYLDNAATSQKPSKVINSITDYYSRSNANPHRGVYKLSVKATEAYEDSRNQISKFIGCNSSELIFTKGATDSINSVVNSLSNGYFSKNDAILITSMEHHSNLVPYQQLCKKLKLKLLFAKHNEQGLLDVEDFTHQLETNNVRFISFTHCSNVLGTINPAKKLVEISRKKSPSSLILLDACQSVGHMPVNFKEIGADFMVFSGHKILGPTGIGCLIGKKQVLESLPPFSFGGDMVNSVSFSDTSFAPIPSKFEAGTANVEGAVGLAAAVSYLQSLGMNKIRNHESEILKFTLENLFDLNYINVLGPSNYKQRNGLVSFNLKNIHSHDVAWILDQQNIAIRAGHHCAMPLHQSLGETSSARASFYVYNGISDAQKLIDGIKEIKMVFA